MVCETPEVVVGEYEYYESEHDEANDSSAVCRLACCGKRQIKLLRESINLFELPLAIYPNGLADDKVLGERQSV